MRSAGQVISREAMTEQALGRKLVAYDRSIDTHISNLRRKLELEAGKNPEIKNVRGSGYTLTWAPASQLSSCIVSSCGFSCCSGSRWRSSSAAASPSPSPSLRAKTRRPNCSAAPPRPSRHRKLWRSGGVGALQELAGQEQERHRRPRAVHHRRRRRGHPRPAAAGERRCAASSSSIATVPGNRRSAARRAANRRPRRLGLHRVYGAAPPQHLRRAQPAGHIH